MVAQQIFQQQELLEEGNRELEGTMEDKEDNLEARQAVQQQQRPEPRVQVVVSLAPADWIVR